MREGPRAGRVPPLMLGAIAAVVVGLVAVVVGIHLSQLNAELASKQQTITTLTADNALLQQQVTALQQEHQELEERLNALRSQLTAATADVARLRETESRARTMEHENANLTQELTQLRAEREAVQSRMAQLEQDKQELERGHAKLRNRLTLLERDYQRASSKLAEIERNAPTFAVGQAITVPDTAMMPDASSGMGAREGANVGASVELPPIVVKKDTTVARWPAIRGQIVEVDAANHFIVVDRGSDHGVRAGVTFEVVRGGVVVGQATASRVRPKISACDVTQLAPQLVPQVGDQIIQRGF